MSLIAENYRDDDERSRAMGTAMGGFALGILAGYPFGGVLYAIAGKAVPFICIALMCVLDIGLQWSLLEPKYSSNKCPIQLVTVYKLFTDPYILICAGAIMVTSMSLAVLESTVPIWAMDTLEAKQWQLGLIFLPDSLGYLLGTNGFAVIAQKYGRWLFTVVSLFTIGTGLVVIPYCERLLQLIMPHFLLGLGVGVTDAAIMPLLALLVDCRHVTTYGSVYAVVQLSVCLAYSLGPGIGGQVVRAFGFNWCIWGMAILNFLCIPMCVILRSPGIPGNKQGITDQDVYLTNETEQEIGTSGRPNYQSFDTMADR